MFTASRLPSGVANVDGKPAGRLIGDFWPGTKITLEVSVKSGDEADVRVDVLLNDHSLFAFVGSRDRLSLPSPWKLDDQEHLKLGISGVTVLVTALNMTTR